MEKRDRLKKLYQTYRPALWVGMGFAVVLYAMMMSQQLTNTFDGLWNQNYYHAGIPELTSGRWLLHYIDKLTLGLHADPVTSLVALALFLSGFLLVLALLGVEDPVVSVLGCCVWLSSVVICNTLSYRMTSIGYALSFFLAVLGIYVALQIRQTCLAVVAGGISLGLSMACYQTYLAAFCVVAVFYLLHLCRTAEAHTALRQIGRCVFRGAVSLLVGGLFYRASLSFFLKLNDASLSSYNGVGDITISGLLAALPENFLKTYHYFRVYFFTDTFRLNRLQALGKGCFLLLLLLFVAAVLWIGIQRRKQPVLVCLLGLAVAAVPVAGSAYMLLAGDKLELQMSAGLALVVPLSLILVLSCLPRKRLPWFLCVFFGLALLYGNAMQVWFDQEAMYEGRNASETIATQIITDLKAENLLSDQYEYVFVGVPAQNETFSVSEAYACANAYAQMGNFWVTGLCNQMSYHGLLIHMGFHLPMSYRTYEFMAERYDLSALPAFPSNGYLTLLDNHFVVIKVSEHADYHEYP